VPAIKLDGRRIQGSLEIARALEQLRTDPPLYPEDPERLARVQDAERWGERELQPVPRRIYRWCARTSQGVRAAMAREVGLPAPGLVAAANKPVAWYMSRKVGAHRDGEVRADLARLPGLLDRVDELIGEGVIGGEALNAADFQIGPSVRVLMTIEDVAPALEGRTAAELARRLMPDYPGGIAAGALPGEWLAPLAIRACARS
jgi:glutathione S-transferase